MGEVLVKVVNSFLLLRCQALLFRNKDQGALGASFIFTVGVFVKQNKIFMVAQGAVHLPPAG